MLIINDRIDHLFDLFKKLIVVFTIICSDDEDDTAELLAELQRIKKERAQEEMKKVTLHALYNDKNLNYCC